VEEVVNQFAFLARTRLRYAALCVFVATTLAGCGEDGASGSSAAAAASGQIQTPGSRTTIQGIPPVAVDAGSSYSFTPTASDPDGSPITFSIVHKPAWATFDEIAGSLAGRPADADVGETPDVQITASNGRTTAAVGPFTVKVRPHPLSPPQNPLADSPPQISGTPANAVVAGQAYAFTPTASDADGDTLRFTIANKPAWAAFDSMTGALTGTPPVSTVGTFALITISVSDGELIRSLPPFSIEVTAISDRAPSISGTPATTVVASQPYSFTPAGSDPDGGKLTFTISNEPSWATFDASTGQLSGTPTAANVGTFAGIVISVSDGQLTAALPAFSIEVAASMNHAPTLSGSPAATVVAGATYSFRPAAQDADGDKLTFSVQNRPAWATFNAASGLLSGTPTTAQVGQFANIVITVTDGKATAALPQFSIAVTAAAGTGPHISGKPVTAVNVGAAYSFTPAATGEGLTFSIQNKPSWASFSTATGALTGTPEAADAGNYANIVVSVSDGKTGASLTAFTVAVNQSSNGSATLSWTPPTDNVDGTTITNLAGYRVYYGTSAGDLAQMAQVANPGLTSYTVGNLSAGTWYFAVSAYTSAGLEGAKSGVVSDTFQ
jgi:hypothetical protein